VVSTVDAIMITAVVTVYGLTLYSIADVRKKLMVHDIVSKVSAIADRKVSGLSKALNFNVNKSNDVSRAFNKFLRFWRSEIGIFTTAYTALTAVVLMKGSMAAAAGLVAVLMILAAASRRLINTEVFAEKSVKTRGFEREVHLRVKISRSARVTVCDDVDESTAVFEGEVCTESLVPAGSEVTLNYKALSFSKQVSRKVLLKLHHPVYLLPMYKVVEAEVRVLWEELSKVEAPKALRRSVKLREPSVESVRPYTIGDELRLVVAKSILYPGGLRTKVLELSQEPSVYDVSYADLITVLQGSYICEYLMGYLQLLQVLKVLEQVGIKRVSIGGAELSLSEVRNLNLFKAVCRRAEISAVSNLVIVSPDALSKLISYGDASNLGTVIILEPVLDAHLKYSKYFGNVSRWISELKQELSMNISLLKSRDVNVSVFTHDGRLTA